MNKYFFNIFFFFALLVGGYQLYPLLNKTVPPEICPNNVDSPKLSEKENSIVTSLHSQIKSIAPVVDDSGEAFGKPEDIASKDKNITEVKPQQVLEKKTPETTIVYTEEIDEASLVEIEELKRWSKQHRENLSELVDNNVAPTVNENFKNFVLSNNPLLDDHTIRQNSFDDEKWGYDIEQGIRYTIHQHRYAQDIEILSVTCKQLVCEIIVREIEKGSWFEVFGGIIRYLLSKGNTVSTEGTKKSLFGNGDEHYAYMQIRFY